jgi:AcrR family transcriptional regulator
MYVKVDKLELIYNATIALIKRVGIAEVSVSKIAKEAGIGKGSIYYYVESKNDILDGIAQKTVKRILDEYYTIVNGGEFGVLERMQLQFQVTANSKFLDGSENDMHVLFIQPDMYLHERLKSAIMKYFVASLENNIVEGTQLGIFKSDNPKKSAELILMAMLMVFDGQLLPTQEMLDTMERMDYLTKIIEKSLSAPEDSLTFVTKILLNRTEKGATTEHDT